MGEELGLGFCDEEECAKDDASVDGAGGFKGEVEGEGEVEEGVEGGLDDEEGGDGGFNFAVESKKKEKSCLSEIAMNEARGLEAFSGESN